MTKRQRYVQKYNRLHRATAQGRTARRRAQRRYKASAKGKATDQRYYRSKGRVTKQKHDRSPAGRASQKRCNHSPKGRASRKRFLTPERISWENMIQRCTYPHAINWHLYGGATPPIRVCKRWLVYKNFLADMGRRLAGTTLSRFGDVGNYEPGNCAWHTKAQQILEANKKRSLTHAKSNHSTYLVAR